MREVSINPPVSGLIGVGKGIAGDLPPDAKVIKSGLGCPKADLDISQAFAISKLGKCHAEVLVRLCQPVIPLPIQTGKKAVGAMKKIIGGILQRKIVTIRFSL